MFYRIKKIFNVLASKQKKKILIFPFLILVVAFLELLGIAMVVPLTTLILSEELFFSSNFLSLNSYFYASSKTKILFIGLALILLIYLIKSFFLIFFQSWKTRLVSSLTKYFSAILYKTYLHQSFFFHLKHNSSSLIRNVNLVQNFVINIDQLAVLITEILILFSFFIFLCFFEIKVTVIAMIVILVMTTVYIKFFNPYHSRLGKERQQSTQEMLQHLNQSFGAIKDIKIFDGYFNFQKDFDKISKKFSDSFQLHEFIGSLPKVLVELFIIALFVLTIGTMSLLNYENNKIIIFASLFAVVGFKFIPSLNKIIFAISHLKFYLPLSSDIIKDLSLKISNNKNISGKLNFENKIFLKKINFSYNKSKPIFKNFNFVIKKNDIIGIEGKTGSGKSTLINILLGLLSPLSGECNVDGKRIKFENTSWQKKIGYVPQNVYLLDDSIKKNIAFAVEESLIDYNKVIMALKLSQSFNFVRALPKFLNSSVGENGSRLSGGQVQRIGIARALYNQPDIMIFDEPSSSLDKKTELEFISALQHLKKNRTIIIVSHTKQILRICNKIYKLENGKVTRSK